MQFHICTIISITTSRLVSPNHIGDIYEILNFMTGDSLFTHQLPRATRECQPYLEDQFPQLKDITPEAVDEWHVHSKESLVPFIQAMVDRFGEWHDVQPIPMDDHDIIDPLQEAIDMVREDKIIGVQINQDEPPSDIGDINWKVE